MPSLPGIAYGSSHKNASGYQDYRFPFSQPDGLLQGFLHLWDCPNRIAELVNHLHQLFRLCGGSTIGIMGLYQLYSFRCDNATELANGHRLLMMPDLLNYLLTGNAVNEYTNATMALLCDQNKRCWEKRILERLRIPGAFLAGLSREGTRWSS